jgi:carbamoyltransferase
MEEVYWGTEIGHSDAVLSDLRKWGDFIEYHEAEDLYEETACLLAMGAVVGWVQGRSEFGPRALGNRSILADPRPAENKDRINLMIKKREGYRPFAPSVLEEEFIRYFETPFNQYRLQYMNFVVKVKEEFRSALGAITHVDGSARVQTVSKSTNSRFWNLIDAFKKKTGIPILLNTSFNNDAEPIADSAEDAIVCYLTTGLDYLVIGDYLIKRKVESQQLLTTLKPSLPAWASLYQVKQHEADGSLSIYHSIRNTYDPAFDHRVQANAYRLLFDADGKRSMAELFHGILWTEEERRELMNEIFDLWSRRLIILRP